MLLHADSAVDLTLDHAAPAEGKENKVEDVATPVKKEPAAKTTRKKNTAGQSLLNSPHLTPASPAVSSVAQRKREASASPIIQLAKEVFDALSLALKIQILACVIR
jgi:hypothetical protein